MNSNSYEDPPADPNASLPHQPADEVRHVVFLIHGIRTQGEWADRVQDVLRSASSRPIVRPVRYGYFDVFRFLIPGPWLKQKAFDRVLDAILSEKDRDPNIHVSVIAHSFGAYLIGAVLKQKPYIRLHRLLLCGSVLRESFEWTKDVHPDQLHDVHADGSTDSKDWCAVNDCGLTDIWPIAAKISSLEYGASGRFGFEDTRIFNRFFSKKHSDFFTDEHIRKFWLPYINDGRIVPSNEHRKTTKMWVSVINLFRLPAIALVVCALAVFLSFFDFQLSLSNTIDEVFSHVSEAVSQVVTEDGNKTRNPESGDNEESNVRTPTDASAAVSTQSQFPSAFSPEQDLVNEIGGAIGNAQDVLVVDENETQRMEGENLGFRSVVLKSNSTLLVPPNSGQFTLRTFRFVAEKGARIVARGVAGKNGGIGAQGNDGSTCESGFNGEHGSAGERGGNGTSIRIAAIELVVIDTLMIDTSGGAGGNGGRGGSGGKGGDASDPQGCGGGTGGAGGVGGAAGDGGDSGSLEIRYVQAYSASDTQISLPSMGTRIEHFATPGTAGLPGGAGTGGFGGSGIARKSLPSGDQGIDGNLGPSGNPGTRGSTTVTSVVTIGG